MGFNSLLPVCLLGFMTFTSVGLLFPAMPPFAASLGATLAQVGIVIALQLYVTAVFVVPIGILSDRIGRRILLIGGISVNLLCFSSYFFITSLNVLMLVRAINGLASAAVYPAISALAIDLVPQEKRGAAFGWLTTSTQFGTMTGPAIGGVILKFLGIQAAFLSGAAISAMALLIALTTLPSVRPVEVVANSNKIITRWLYDRFAVGSLVATMFVMLGTAVIISFLPLYGAELGIDIARVGLILSSVYLGSVLTRAVAGWASDKLGRTPVILVGSLLGAIGIFFMGTVTQEFALHIAAFIFGLGMGSTLPACGALLADVAPASMRGFAMGCYTAAFHGGQALGATGMGIVAASVGFARMYLFTAVLMGFAIILTFILTRGRRTRYYAGNPTN